METYNIQGVEIFSVGKWNGDEYTHDDLQGMVVAFEENKVAVRPFLKLGHDDDQKLLQNDGLPAAGWIDRVYLYGDKLIADFSSIPKKIFELITSKAYRKVSSEIYWNVKIGDKTYKRMLGAVALLGADTPGVMNLNDILGMYSKVKGDERHCYELKHASFGEKETPVQKTESEIKLELDLKAKADENEQLKKDYSKSVEDQKAKEKEIEQLRADKLAADRRASDLAAESEKTKREQFTSELVSQKLCSVAMKPYVMELLGEEKKEYAFGDKKLSKQDVVSEMLKLFKAATEVNFVESSKTGKEDDDKRKLELEQDAEIKKYASEHKITYGQATKAILAQQKKK